MAFELEHGTCSHPFWDSSFEKPRRELRIWEINFPRAFVTVRINVVPQFWHAFFNVGDQLYSQVVADELTNVFQGEGLTVIFGRKGPFSMVPQ